MKIYKDICTGDELFSDSYKMGDDGPDDFLITLEGKLVTRKIGSGISADLIGGNPSQEEQEEQTEDTDSMESGIDIVLDMKLKDQSDFFTSKKVVQGYLKKWMKNTAEALKEEKDKCESFKKCCIANIKYFLDKWSTDATIYTGEKFDPEEAKSSLLIGVWTEDGCGITLYGIRTGLEEEKC